MARQKSYDREEAVGKARDAFWEHGFQNLGIRAIEDIVGVGRFAIRTDFKGKEGLFLEALALYREDLVRDIVQPIREADDLCVLKDILTRITTPRKGSCGKFGCLLVNTMVENASLQNAKFREYTKVHFDDLLDAIIGLLDRAKANGQVRSDVDSVAAAEFMRGAMMTISLLSRDSQDVTAPAGYLKMALATIDSWRKVEG